MKFHAFRWIKRAERLSRVRKMVEAMEKYRYAVLCSFFGLYLKRNVFRVRQMEALQDTYSRKFQNVRDNYHHQVCACLLALNVSRF